MDKKKININRFSSLRMEKIDERCPIFVISFLARSLSIDLFSLSEWEKDEDTIKKTNILQ